MSADHAHALPAGYDLHEYRVVGMVGAGGFGITYRVYDVHLDKELALKEYLPNHWATRAAGDTVAPLSSTYAADYEWGLRRFLDEARTLARFNHPHLNRVHRFFEANGTGYMVLEYVGGETLAARLNRELRLPEEALRRLLEEVLSGLALVHGAGVVHRDIKPANLMLRAEDGGAVLLDFGAARQAVGRQSGLVSLVLTPGYAPIEQHAGEAGRMGPWTDIYALGMVAYRCLSGMRDDELPHSVARASAQHRGGEDLLAPAVEAGKGRYSLELLEAVDWAIKVDEEARPRRVEAWCEAWSGAGGRDTDEAGRARRRLEGQLDSLASSGVGGGGLRSVRRGGSVRGSRAAAGVRASEGEAASGGGGSAGVGGAGRRWGIRALALVVLVVYVMSAFRWMSVYGPEEDGLAMTETAEVTEPAQEEAQQSPVESPTEQPPEAQAAAAEPAQVSSGLPPGVDADETCVGKPEGSACWIELENHPGCYLWNGNLQMNETATWSAGCAGGLAEGTGEAAWVFGNSGEDVATSTGQIRQGKYHGRWVVRGANGNVGEGPYVDGKRHGRWVWRYANGQVDEGPVVDGKRHGRWVVRGANGNVGEGPYVDGKEEGHWVWRYANGQVDEGPVVDGKRHGRWVVREADGDVGEGPYVDGKDEGHWVWRYANGQVDEGPVVDGKRHGRWVVREADGDVGEGPYVDGKQEGHWVWRFAGGQVEEGSYVDNKRHGPWVVRPASGERYNLNFVEGERQ